MIQQGTENRRDKKRKSNLGYKVTMLLLLFIAGISGVMLVGNLTGSHDNEMQIESLAAFMDQALADQMKDRRNNIVQEEKELGMEDKSPLSAEEVLELRQKRLEFYKALKEQNSDMVGWVKIDGTKIDYPVMQTPDMPDFYLTHDFERKKSIYGVPYVGESCTLELTGGNVLLYGHHMKDGSMFAELMQYAKEDYYKEHPMIQFDLLDEIGDYEIIAAFKITAKMEEADFYRAIRAETKEQFESYIKEVKLRSFYQTDSEVSYGDQLITLITCEYTIEDGRMCVVGKKIS